MEHNCARALSLDCYNRCFTRLVSTNLLGPTIAPFSTCLFLFIVNSIFIFLKSHTIDPNSTNHSTPTAKSHPPRGNILISTSNVVLCITHCIFFVNGWTCYCAPSAIVTVKEIGLFHQAAHSFCNHWVKKIVCTVWVNKYYHWFSTNVLSNTHCLIRIWTS